MHFKDDSPLRYCCVSTSCVVSSHDAPSAHAACRRPVSFLRMLHHCIMARVAMWSRRRPVLASAVVARMMRVVTLTAQWCALPLCPPRTRVSVLCEAKVAESARDAATVYAGAVERIHVAGCQDFHVELAPAFAPAFAIALAVALAFAFAWWFFALALAIVFGAALAFVLAAGPQVYPTAKGHGWRLRGYSKPQEGHLRAMKGIHVCDEFYVYVSEFVPDGLQDGLKATDSLAYSKHPDFLQLHKCMSQASCRS